jgi:hypothetical protein
MERRSSASACSLLYALAIARHNELTKKQEAAMRLHPFILVIALMSSACTNPQQAGPSLGVAPRNHLVGTWELVSTRMTRGDSVVLDAVAPAIRAVKILNATHFSVITVRGENQFLRAAAGRYALDGDRYTESIEISSGRFTPSQTYAFRSRVAGDTWSIDGGTGSDRFQEVWRRVR